MLAEACPPFSSALRSGSRLRAHRWNSAGPDDLHRLLRRQSTPLRLQRIVRRPKGHKRYVYTFVSNEALASARRKVKALTGRSTTNIELSELIAALNPVLRGWANYFRHAAAKRTFDYLGYYAWWRVGRWLRKKHPRMTWKQIARRYTSNGTFQEKGIALFNTGSISVTRYRGARIPNPWDIPPTADPSGLRTHRASREEQRSLGRLQQALA